MPYEARETVGAFREDVIAAGLAEHVDAILVACTTCTYAVLDEPGEGPSGDSRVGGSPDLRVGMAWPVDTLGRPLRFALQVNLRDLPDPGAHGLPSRGLVSLFLGILQPATDLSHATFLFGDVDALDRRAPPDGVSGDEDLWIPVLKPHGLRFERRIDPSPSVLEGLVEEDDGPEGTRWRYHDLCGERTYPVGTVARIGGHHVEWDGPPAKEAVRARLLGDAFSRAEVPSEDMDRAASAWSSLVTLLSVDELDLVIWDAGLVQVLVHEVGLRSGCLAGTYARVASS